MGDLSRPRPLAVYLRVAAGLCAIITVACWWAIIQGLGDVWGTLSLATLFGAVGLLAAASYVGHKASAVVAATIGFTCHVLGLLICPVLVLLVATRAFNVTSHDIYHGGLVLSTIGTGLSQMWIRTFVVPRALRSYAAKRRSGDEPPA